MALNLYSGKDAYVDGAHCVQSWQATQAVSASRYTASCIPGATAVAPGIQNWSGQMSGVGAWPDPVFPGIAPFSFLGVINTDAGLGDLLSLAGTVYLEQLTIDINKETAAPISWQSTFGFDGNATTSASSATDDLGVPVATYGDSLDVKLGSSFAGAATIAAASVCIRSAQIVFRRQVTTFVKDGTTYRRPGTLECDVNFSVYSPNLFVASYLPNTLAHAKIYVSPLSYWAFGNLRILGKSNLQTDRNSNNILGYTVNAQWNATVPGLADDLGYIGFWDEDLADDPISTMYYGENPE